MATATFDTGLYKETTRLQWQEAAAAWHRWDPVFDGWLGEATQLLLDLTGIGAGSRVLDIAAGSGGQSLAAARRGARVLATDIASNILGEAEAAAREAGLPLETKLTDGEELDVAAGSFDAAISRLGLMYLPDKPRALARAAAALRPGGRYGAIVFAEPEQNAFFSVPISIIRRRAGLPAPAPGQPGPFSATALGGLLEDAGYRDVEVRRVDAPLRLASAAECTQLERESFGALHAMLAALSEAERDEAWAEVEEALSAFEEPGGFAGPCELLVGAGSV